MNKDKKKRRVIIAVITMILLIVLSLWLFTRASEDTEETPQYYQSYRNNILGVAGDFAVFTYGDASVSEVKGDIAIGGDYNASGGFGGYGSKWDFYKSKTDLRHVNLNSYIRGKFNGTIYNWDAAYDKGELTDESGNVRGTYDVGNTYGKANIYLHTDNNTYEQYSVNNGQEWITKINNEKIDSVAKREGDLSYPAYNLIGVDYEFIDFEAEFQNLSNISETLMHSGEQVEVDCAPESGKTYTYNFPEGQDTVLITVNPANFFDGNVCDTFNINGLDSTKKIVINVPCEGYLNCKSPIININGSADDWNALAENIIFNYYLPEFVDQPIQVDCAIGTILAPNMNININGNLDGAVLARKVEANQTIQGINSNIGWDDLDVEVVERTSISGTKIWNDEGEEDKRPEEITIKLLADGEDTGKTVTLPKVITNNTSSDDSSSSETSGEGKTYYIEFYIPQDILNYWWAFSKEDSYTFTIEYNDGTSTSKTISIGDLMTWGSAQTITIPDGKNATVSSVSTKIGTSSNSQAPYDEIYISNASVSEGTTGKMYTGTTGNWITFELGSTSGTNSVEINNGGTSSENPETPTEDEEDNLDWTYKFERLEKYDAEGNEIKYTVEEVEAEGYVSEIVETENGYDIINTIKTEITGEKIWDDDNDRDGKRPETITVELYEKGKDGEEDVKVDEIVVKQGEDEDAWSYKFEDVKKYDEEGNEIEYIVKEATVQEYEAPVIEGNVEEGFTITNKYTPEKIDIKVTKVWEDDNNRDGVRPSTVTVQLFKGEEVVETKEMNSDKWECTFEDLYKYEDGKEIEYTVKEVELEGDYSSAVAHSSMENWTITNTHEIEKVSVKVEKRWLDDKEEDRPESITIKLMNGTTEVATKTVTASDDWKCEFTDLPKKVDGEQIEYTVEEVAVEGYTSLGAKPKEDEENSFIIGNKKNTVTPKPEKITFTGTKTWDDEGHEDERPESITVKLMDGEEVVNDVNGNPIIVTVKPDADGNWTYTLADIPASIAVKETCHVEEELPAGYADKYEVIVNGKDITNKYVEVDTTTKVVITKVWDDEGYEDKRPEEITVNLLANGEVKETKKLTAADEWKWEIADLPDTDDDGNPIEYTITEEPISEYKTTIDGFNITNTYTVIDAEEIEPLKIVKVWDDEGYEEFRPEKVTVNILANGEVIETVEITANDNWEYTFKDMEKYDEEGKEIVYTVTEEAITGYETTIDGLKITNTYIPPVQNDEFVIKINKYQTGTTTKLEGAKFEITLKDKDDKKVAKETATTNSIGQIMLKDIEIAAGEYTLEIKETSAPKGYTIAKETIKIEFTVSEDEDGKQTIKLKEKYKNAEVEKMTITVKAENDKEKTKDTTTVTGKLPQTGAGSMIAVVSVVIAFIVIGAIGIIKYREIKF